MRRRRDCRVADRPVQMKAIGWCIATNGPCNRLCINFCNIIEERRAGAPPSETQTPSPEPVADSDAWFTRTDGTPIPTSWRQAYRAAIAAAQAEGNEADRLRAELAALRTPSPDIRDAERYRWLRLADNNGPRTMQMQYHHVEHLDRAIDTAIAKEKL